MQKCSQTVVLKANSALLRRTKKNQFLGMVTGGNGFSGAFAG